MAISLLLDEVFYEGVTASSQTPRPYPVSINGRGYIPDFSFHIGMDAAFQQQSIDMLRPQADTANSPGQQSLNPYGLWRRVQGTWVGGAGQSYLDRTTSSQATTSDETRFRTSKGINPWNPWQLSLLNDTTLQRSSANTNLAMVQVGSLVFAIDGQSTVVGLGSLSGASTISGTPSATASSICSDGYNVYVAYGASGLYTCVRDLIGSASQLVTTALGTDSICRYVKGRLLVSKGSAIYNVVSPTSAALPSALFTQANSDFRWVDCAEGPANIYMAGYSGDKSLIYRTAVKTDGTGLDAPQIAGELPDGETVTSIQGYLGFMLVGSNIGVRFAQIDASGNLVLGDYIPTSLPVRCFEGQGSFVWYGLSNFDSTSTGLGRMDLRTLNDSAPAYASDLMATAQGEITSVITNNIVSLGSTSSARMFAVSGVGFYTENTSARVSSGTIDSGLISYGIADQKVAAFLHLDYAYLFDGNIQTYLAQDDGPFTLVGTASTVGSKSAEFPTDQTLSDHFEMRLVLNAGASSIGPVSPPGILITDVWPPVVYVTTSAGPIVTRATLRANPAAQTGYLVTVPVRLHETLLVDGNEVACVPSLELGFLDEIRQTKQVVTLQVGASSYTVTVESIDWFPSSMGRNNTEINGVAVVGMKTLQ